MLLWKKVFEGKPYHFYDQGKDIISLTEDGKPITEDLPNSWNI